MNAIGVFSFKKSSLLFYRIWKNVWRDIFITKINTILRNFQFYANLFHSMNIQEAPKK